MSKPDDKEYQRLKKIWYKKLEKSGFDDIEQDEDNLKIWSVRWARASDQLSNQDAREDYYYMANQFLTNYDFDSKLDRIIWEYHTNAISYRDIAKLLRKAKVSKLGYNGIYLKIKSLKKIMFDMYLKSDK